mmetsp:Transcript_7377/g.21789  ORF Transcript_7377/g.21789 Transcript_7377/m.21789 type:complete len:166 (-) Transcript_7377:1839-2336(-)
MQVRIHTHMREMLSGSHLHSARPKFAVPAMCRPTPSVNRKIASLEMITKQLTRNSGRSLLQARSAMMSAVTGHQVLEVIQNHTVASAARGLPADQQSITSASAAAHCVPARAEQQIAASAAAAAARVEWMAATGQVQAAVLQSLVVARTEVWARACAMGGCIRCR